ncbi:MAG TPA: hypothetical protein VE404_09135 [Verrucomicrobiae bacterium]|nr:hypothetical protein [Verrucomicrobiae bacterium]
MIRTTLTIVLASAALAGVSTTTQPPPPPAPRPVMVEIPYGILIHDDSCPGATHALLDPCAPHPIEVYVRFPADQNLREFEGTNVILRGSLHGGGCARLVLKASSIGPSTEPFVCDGLGDGETPGD